jgi:hypothetical protein
MKWQQLQMQNVLSTDPMNAFSAFSVKHETTQAWQFFIPFCCRYKALPPNNNKKITEKPDKKHIKVGAIPLGLATVRY